MKLGIVTEMERNEHETWNRRFAECREKYII